LRALIDQLRDLAEGAGETQFVGVEIPYPDLNNPDPVVALSEAWAFEAWLMETGPFIGFVDVYNYPSSPRLREINSDFLQWDGRDLRFDEVVDTYELLTGEVVPLEVAAMSKRARDSVPPGSVAVAYTDRGGPYPLIIAATGEVLETIEGYEGAGVVVIAPSELGWQLYWSGEATE